MKWRKISEEEVMLVLSDPEKTEESIFGRTNMYRTIGQRYVKVTFKTFSDETLIISVVDKSRGGQP